MDTTEEMLTVNKREENLLIIHTGLNDILGRRRRGLSTRIKEAVNQLRVITSKMVQSAVRTIPG
ncbi:hypothetical protein HPB47_015829, partial [Ixodes persulcatus]